MSNALLVIDQVQIRRDADGRYCLNDLHKAAGGADRDEPNRWFRGQKTQELIAALKSPDLGISPIESSRGQGAGSGTFVVKELVYDYAAWISAEFRIKVYRAYDAMVTGQMTTQQQVAAISRKQLALYLVRFARANNFLPVLRVRQVQICTNAPFCSPFPNNSGLTEKSAPETRWMNIPPYNRVNIRHRRWMNNLTITEKSAALPAVRNNRPLTEKSAPSCPPDNIVGLTE